MAKLNVNEAVVVEVGPCINATDFKSIETVSWNAAGMSLYLIKNSGTVITYTAITATSGGANDWVHKAGGVHSLEITAAQNNVAGTIRVVGVCTGILPFESPVYETGGLTTNQKADVNAEADTAVAALNDLSAAEFQAALLAIVGVTVGGTMTLQKLLKIQAAWIAGNWRRKTADPTVQELLDADNGTTVILEQSLIRAPSAGSDYRAITVKI